MKYSVKRTIRIQQRMMSIDIARKIDINLHEAAAIRSRALTRDDQDRFVTLEIENEEGVARIYIDKQNNHLIDKMIDELEKAKAYLD